MRSLLALIVFATAACRPEPVPLNPHKRATAPVGAEVDRDVTLAQAPETTVKKRDGSAFDLAQLWSSDKKTKTLIVFYRGGWCPYCRKQLGELQEEYRKFAEVNAVVVAISNEGGAEATALRDKLGLGFELYSDPELTTIAKWGVEDFGAGIAKPATFVVQPGGAITFRRIGDSPADRPSIDELIAALK